MNGHKKCRLCGSASSDPTSIFGPAEGKSLLVVDLIKLICPIPIDVNDPLSKVICGKCLSVIIAAYELRLTSVRNNQKWNQKSQIQKPIEKKQRYGNLTRKRIRTPEEPVKDVYETSSIIEIDPKEAESFHENLEVNTIRNNSSNRSNLFINLDKTADDSLSDTGELLCEVCGKNFHSSVGIKKHYTLHHPQKKILILWYTCPDEKCKDKKFTSRDSLTKHKNTHNIQKLQKMPSPKILHSTMKKTEGSNNQLRKSVDPFVCGVCDESYSSSEILNIHKSRMHGRVYIK